MNEMRFPEVPPTAPTPTPPEPTQPPSEGSLALGVGLAWLIIVGGGILVSAMGYLRSVGMLMLLMGPLPFFASIALGIWMLVKGPRRTGLGIFIGIGSIAAVMMLLVAACFGYFVSSWGR